MPYYIPYFYDISFGNGDPILILVSMIIVILFSSFGISLLFKLLRKWLNDLM